MTTDRTFPRTVTIYGTGLIGCSLALALKQNIPGVRIFGIDSPDILNRAQAVGAIDFLGTGDSVASDLVILSAPVGEILRLIEKIQPGSSIILDVGSTKVDICKRAGGQSTGARPGIGGVNRNIGKTIERHCR